MTYSENLTELMKSSDGLRRNYENLVETVIIHQNETDEDKAHLMSMARDKIVIGWQALRGIKIDEWKEQFVDWERDSRNPTYIEDRETIEALIDELENNQYMMAAIVVKYEELWNLCYPNGPSLEKVAAQADQNFVPQL